MDEMYYIFVKDGLLKHESRILSFTDLDEACVRFFQIKAHFIDACDGIMSCLTETVLAPGNIRITDGENYFELVLSKGVKSFA